MQRRQGAEQTMPTLCAYMGRLAVAGCLAVLGFLMAPAQAWPHDCVVKDWAVASGVIARQPYGRNATFRAEQVDEVFAFANLDCTKVSGVAVFRFFRDNKMVLAVETPIRAGDNWRTWAAVRAQPGKYLVMLEIEQAILMEDTFEITD